MKLTNLPFTDCCGQPMRQTFKMAGEGKDQWLAEVEVECEKCGFNLTYVMKRPGEAPAEEGEGDGLQK